MSQSNKKGGRGGDGGGGKGGPPKKNDDNDNKNKEKEKEKDEPNANNNEDEVPVTSKPQSAGTSSRDVAQKVLLLCQKGEWAPVDQVLKVIEKNIVAQGDDANTVPLAGVVDLVRILSRLTTKEFKKDKIQIKMAKLKTNKKNILQNIIFNVICFAN